MRSTPVSLKTAGLKWKIHQSMNPVIVMGRLKQWVKILLLKAKTGVVVGSTPALFRELYAGSVRIMTADS